MKEMQIFGYGTTLWLLPEYDAVEKFKIPNFARCWCHRDFTVQGTDIDVLPIDGGEIWGLLFTMNDDNDHLMEKRENNYREEPILVGDQKIYTFASQLRYRRIPDENFPVFLSDVCSVVLGYNKWYGLDGVQHLIDTTLSWNFPVYNDKTDDDLAISSKDFKRGVRLMNKFRVLKTLVKSARYDLKV